jgi:hypothetical protein
MDTRDDREGKETVSGEELAAMLFEGYVCSIARAASLLGLTVQRVNQLAIEGVVVKLGRGACDLTETIHRYAAYQNEVERNKKHGRPATRHSPAYWAMKSRQLRLADGATFGELAQLHRAFRMLGERIEALLSAASTQGQVRENGKLQSGIVTAFSTVGSLFDEIEQRGFAHGGLLRRYDRDGTV